MGLAQISFEEREREREREKERDNLVSGAHVAAAATTTTTITTVKIITVGLVQAAQERKKEKIFVIVLARYLAGRIQFCKNQAHEAFFAKWQPKTPDYHCTTPG